MRAKTLKSLSLGLIVFGLFSLLWGLFAFLFFAFHKMMLTVLTDLVAANKAQGPEEAPAFLAMIQNIGLVHSATIVLGGGLFTAAGAMLRRRPKIGRRIGQAAALGAIFYFSIGLTCNVILSLDFLDDIPIEIPVLSIFRVVWVIFMVLMILVLCGTQIFLLWLLRKPLGDHGEHG